MPPPLKPPIPHGLVGGFGGVWVEIGNIDIKYKFINLCYAEVGQYHKMLRKYDDG